MGINNAFMAGLKEFSTLNFDRKNSKFAQEEFESELQVLYDSINKRRRQVNAAFKDVFARPYMKGWEDGVSWAVAYEFREFDVTDWDVRLLISVPEEDR